MFDSLYIGATGMISHQTYVDTIANNLANLNTIGFRRGLVSFSDISAQLAPTDLQPDGRSMRGQRAAQSWLPDVLQGAGSLAQVGLSLVAGTLESTSQPLDLAISGAGFFEVLRPDGSPAYSRAGSLRVNGDGLLALADGTPLAAQIQIPTDAQNITIGSDGTVTALLGNATTPTQIGRITLVNFANPGALSILGGNQYTASAAAGAPQSGTPGTNGLGQLQQGYLETSDVDLNQEMTNLLLAQRGFELNSKIVQTADQLWSVTNGLVRS
jgi:flagellar basal-body rod protein FlgG